MREAACLYAQADKRAIYYGLGVTEHSQGLSLSEGILQRPDQLFSIEIKPIEDGIEVDMHVAGDCYARLREQCRTMAGRTGCGLCGRESLAIREAKKCGMNLIGFARSGRHVIYAHGDEKTQERVVGDQQLNNLIRVLDQIIANNLRHGDNGKVTDVAVDHLQKFWARSMKQQIIVYANQSPVELSVLAKLTIDTLEPTTE